MGGGLHACVTGEVRCGAVEVHFSELGVRGGFKDNNIVGSQTRIARTAAEAARHPFFPGAHKCS
jgi:hypothetical protein